MKGTIKTIKKELVDLGDQVFSLSSRLMKQKKLPRYSEISIEDEEVNFFRESRILSDIVIIDKRIKILNKKLFLLIK